MYRALDAGTRRPAVTSHPHRSNLDADTRHAESDAISVGHSSTAEHPGDRAVSKQPQLPGTLPISPIPFGTLQEMAKSQIRRECRRLGFDWDRFIEEEPIWSLTEVVHRRAVNTMHRRGLSCSPADIPTDTVLMAVRNVIDQWDDHKELRPSAEGFRQEQIRRGKKGQEKQNDEAKLRAARVMALVDEGINNNAEIGRRLGLNRSTVMRIRNKHRPKQKTGANTDDFPAPEIPRHHRWPVRQLMLQTNMNITADEARWLADMGQCYEAEGREDDMMYAISAAAGESIRDPWAYLKKCIQNRGDAWTVSPELLGDVLTHAGQQSLEYALCSIGAGYVRKPVAYLQTTLQTAVERGEGPQGHHGDAKAIGVALCRRWAPSLAIQEPKPTRKSCIGLKGLRGDSNYPEYKDLKTRDSSPRPLKASATPIAVSGLEDLEQARNPAIGGAGDENRHPQTHGEALKASQTTCRALDQEKRPPVLEHGRCTHPLATAIATAMELGKVELVDCTEGCGHQLYSDRGPIRCPCHWPHDQAVQITRELQRQPTAVQAFPGASSTYADVRMNDGR